VAAAQVAQILTALTPASPSVSYESRRDTSRGVRWEQWVSTGIFDPDGHLREVQSVGRDITEYKDAVQRWRESEERLALALDATALGLWDWDVPSGAILRDERWAALLGYRLDELEPGISGLHALVHPDDYPALQARAVAHLRGEAEAYDSEHRMRAHSGEWRWIHSRGRIVERDAEGQPRRVIGTMRDVTEARREAEALRASEERLRLANVELEQAVGRRTAELRASLQELEAFSYSVSHDLRGPLRAIDGFSQALAEEYGERLDAGGLDHLARVRRAAQRMGDLIDDLLALARVMRGDLRRGPVPLGALAREILAELARGEPGRRVAVIVDDALAAQGDARLLRVALANLLENAWKFTRPRAAATITFATETVAGERAYVVRDDGVGFDMTYADKLFTPFQRLHDGGEFEGTGIGLATVLRIVTRHGGRIWAEGVPDRGAAFYFTLAAPRGSNGDAR
jgi:PAS domain S-box-containing protein